MMVQKRYDLMFSQQFLRSDFFVWNPILISRHYLYANLRECLQILILEITNKFL